MSEVLAELRGITKRFPGAGREVTDVLAGVDLAIVKGESLAIVGPSGSGKSTLLHLLGALDQPTSGRVVLEGEDLGPLSAERLAEVRNRRIGFVFQLHHLLPQCAALENVLVPTLVHTDAAERRRRAERGRALLERVGLGERLTHRPSELSGGECQRVAVVRALINEPALLLADEPTGSLDAQSSDGLCELLVELNKEEGVTLVVVTHSESLAARMGRVLELSGGELRARDSGR